MSRNYLKTDAANLMMIITFMIVYILIIKIYNFSSFLAVIIVILYILYLLMPLFYDKAKPLEQYILKAEIVTLDNQKASFFQYFQYYLMKLLFYGVPIIMGVPAIAILIFIISITFSTLSNRGLLEDVISGVKLGEIKK